MSTFLDVMGPRIQLLTDLQENPDYSLMKAEIPPGVIDPVHSMTTAKPSLFSQGNLKLSRKTAGKAFGLAIRLIFRET